MCIFQGKKKKKPKTKTNKKNFPITLEHIHVSNLLIPLDFLWLIGSLKENPKFFLCLGEKRQKP